MEPFNSTVAISIPMAQSPIVMRTSISVGAYSGTSPMGVGIKPGTTVPMPFSIQIPMMARIQANGSSP